MQTLEHLRIRYLRYLVAPALRLAGPRFAVALARRLSRGVYAMNPPGRARALGRVKAAIDSGLFEQTAGVQSVGDRSVGDWNRAISSRVVSAEALAAESYEHFGRFWAEALFVPRRLGGAGWRRFVEIQNEASIQRLVDDRRGCLIAVGYHGNIAAAACVLGHFFRPLHVVVDTVRDPSMVAWQRELYRQPNLKIIERMDAGHRVPEALERGGAVMIVAEHARSRGPGVPVSFMGRAFAAYPTIGILSRQFAAPVGVVTCHRGDAAFEFGLDLCDVIEPAACGGDADEIVRRVFASLERSIMQTPSQYLWGQETAAGGAVEAGGVITSRSMSLAGANEIAIGLTAPVTSARRLKSNATAEHCAR